MERGERGGWRRRRRNELFVIPTKGKSLFTFVISIELIRGIPLVAVGSKGGRIEIWNFHKGGDLKVDGKGGRGGVIHSSLRLAYEIYTNVKHGVFGRGGPPLFPVLPSFSSTFKAAVVVFLSTARPTHGGRERERKSQAFISQVTRARDWRSIKGRFTRPDSDANRRKINTAYYSVRINRSTWAMSTNAISFCSKRVDIRGMRWPRSRRPGTDRPRSESLIEPRRRRPRRRPLSFVLSNARDVKNVDRALDYIAVYRTQIEEERSSSLRTIFAITRPCTHLEIIGNLLLCKALHTRVSKKC